jgi:hypothetical protein
MFRQDMMDGSQIKMVVFPGEWSWVGEISVSRR